MDQGKYRPADSCRENRQYYLQINTKNGKAAYQPVRFLAYRPHPAEALVHDGHKIRLVHRRFLFCKNGSQ